MIRQLTDSEIEDAETSIREWLETVAVEIMRTVRGREAPCYDLIAAIHNSAILVQKLGIGQSALIAHEILPLAAPDERMDEEARNKWWESASGEVQRAEHEIIRASLRLAAAKIAPPSPQVQASRHDFNMALYRYRDAWEKRANEARSVPYTARKVTPR